MTVLSKVVPVAALLTAVVLTAFLVGLSWRHFPVVTAAVFGLFVVGGGFAVRHPKNAVGYSVTLGAVLGIFLGAAIILVRAMHAT